ncbi:MAG: Polar amino acid ABC transporter, inner membrane subunit [Clostridia bacterium 41_269]|nr:MAG: Polar amino acid ABC transporter, inner membrane subunit [Clostridia bacterium 41_269]
MRWDFIIEIFPKLLRASVLTLELTIAGISIGIVIGLIASLMRISGIKLFSVIAKIYVDFFRGTPLLVQIAIIHYALPVIFDYVPVAIVSGVIALGINSGAYVAEIFRAGIQSIDKGQMEAARSLGMTWGQAMRYIILPQAFKVSIPPLGNEFIALLKDSSLVSIIAVEELMTTGRLIMGKTPLVAEIWFSVAMLYLVMTSTIAVLVNYVERRLQIGDSSQKSA